MGLSLPRTAGFKEPPHSLRPLLGRSCPGLRALPPRRDHPGHSLGAAPAKAKVGPRQDSN